MNERIVRSIVVLVCAHALLSVTSMGAATGRTRLTAVGVTQPVTDETLSSLVSGKIVAVHFREGDQVRKGDVIIDLAKRLDELELARRKLAWESKVELESARAREEMLKKVLEGTRRVHETTKSISLDELNKADFEHKSAMAEVAQIQIEEELQGLEVEKAEELIKMRQIRSPLTGVLARVALEVGENCQPHQPLFRVVDISRCYFVVNLEAAIARELELGQEVTIELPAGEKVITCTGKVSFISPVVDSASGLQEVKALFDNPGDRFYPGVSGSLILVP